MGKWFGKIGYSVTEETEPGIWESKIVEREYFGDLENDYRKRQSTDKLNDDISLSCSLSILADPFLYENCSDITYAEIMGTKWDISNIEVRYPRLILTVGGKYNGPET